MLLLSGCSSGGTCLTTGLKLLHWLGTGWWLVRCEGHSLGLCESKREVSQNENRGERWSDGNRWQEEKGVD